MRGKCAKEMKLATGVFIDSRLQSLLDRVRQGIMDNTDYVSDASHSFRLSDSFYMTFS